MLHHVVRIIDDTPEEPMCCVAFLNMKLFGCDSIEELVKQFSVNTPLIFIRTDGVA